MRQRRNNIPKLVLEEEEDLVRFVVFATFGSETYRMGFLGYDVAKDGYCYGFLTDPVADALAVAGKPALREWRNINTREVLKVFSEVARTAWGRDGVLPRMVAR